MMADGSRDPYERMLDDALESLGRVNSVINGFALSINTADRDRVAIFKHIDEMRKEIREIHKLTHGDGNGFRGYSARIRSLESWMAEADTKLQSVDEAKGEKWKAMAQIAVAVVAALSLYLQLTGG